MKRFISLFLIAILSFSILTSCAGGQYNTVNDKRTYCEPYGLCDKDEKKIEGIHYSVSVGNVILAVIFCETVIVPVLVFGWYLYEPEGLRDPKEKNNKEVYNAETSNHSND